MTPLFSRHSATLASTALVPLALWVVLPLWGVRALLVTLMALLTPGLALPARRVPTALLITLLAVALIGGYAEAGVRLYPVLVNAGLALFFLQSLRTTPLIERLARRREPALPPSGVRYTRKVTRAWGLFFTANALVTLALSLWAPLGLWQLYVGALSYVLAALFGAGEWLIRRRVRGRDAQEQKEAP